LQVSTKGRKRGSQDSNVRRPKGRTMSLDKSESFEPANSEPVAETLAVVQQKEAPRKRYAPPSAPRVLRCMLPTVKS
jgi:hypothetical protein